MLNRAIFGVGMAALLLVIAVWESSVTSYQSGSYVAWQVVKFMDDHNGLVTAIATAFIGIFTYTLWRVSKQQGLDTRVIQRAYVKLSHPPPGIEQLDSSGHIWLTISIKNFGQTPATVTDVVIRPVVIPRPETLPSAPDYTYEMRGPTLRAFLVTNDEFSHSRFYRITPDEFEKVKDLQSDLYVIGYVDYIDQFGQRHRGGYARQYHPMVDLRRVDTAIDQKVYAARNNLMIVAQAGYNYDRFRVRGEGHDWSDNQS